VNRKAAARLSEVFKAAITPRIFQTPESIYAAFASLATRTRSRMPKLLAQVAALREESVAARFTLAALRIASGVSRTSTLKFAGLYGCK
jgi:hypothetical protein